MSIDFLRKKNPFRKKLSPSIVRSPPDSDSILKKKEFLEDFEKAEIRDASSKESPIAKRIPSETFNWLRGLAKGLASTSSKLKGEMTAILSGRRLDDGMREELEELLIRSDMGVDAAQKIVNGLVSRRYEKDVSIEFVLQEMSLQINEILEPVSKPFNLIFPSCPHVILVVGVNGVGKTTTIGKLAKRISDSGLSVMLAAGDTFRAAAVDQLKIWADRTASDFIGAAIGTDPSALVYEAFNRAKAKNTDVLIIDTAGRLQNNVELMAEIGKMIRVLNRLNPDAPHSVIQVLDASIGQNALNQVETFCSIAGVTGLIMTKLDGTARGGILVSVAMKHQLPVYFIGIGEGISDLNPFVAKDFATAISGLFEHERENT
ncbi:signal recognition particle-docking protein FtsY [Candidatus Liberibacter sp.]|uniref:signal recognition particle-docking protein FtsY n=1 Tax=Candidatus Liberibacter sp. TaxID=34022 RepID=UPI0028705C90|nr:signal recognition particle-docking protein FtsY [Candidatus Liberibacter sp.]